MAENLIKYRIWCSTDSQWEYTNWIEDDAAVPTTCPINTGHTIDGTKTSAYRQQKTQSLKTPDNILLTTPHAQNMRFELCDRDIKLVTCKYDVPATLTISGADANGNITYTPTIRGDYANCITVAHVEGAREFAIVVEYEAEHVGADFFFNLFYGCGDPSTLVLGKTDSLRGESGGKTRQQFFLDKEFLKRNELFRFTLEVNRTTPHPVIIYGAWLELSL